MNPKKNLLGLVAGLSLTFVLAGCGNSDSASNTSKNEDGTVNYSEAVEYTITGIEPGAGITGQAHNTLAEYDNLEGWELQESSTAGMLVALDEAIKNEEPIIVTGWAPHWMNSRYDLKYLEDPKGTFGGAEDINTFVRKGLEEDMPNAYKILDNFNWDVADMELVMNDAQVSSFEEAASKWIEENTEKVSEWTEGTEKVDGVEITLVTTQWDTELASAEVMKQVLEEQGFKVKVTSVDPAIVFEALANSEADASLAPWLPSTHGLFLEKHKENVVDLGVNLTGTQNGLVVPAYMEIDSIEDLQPKE